MNDFDYEVMQRKRTAQSARHKKNGVKSKKCSLPSDGMTQKQWKERNGVVMEYNLNNPMRWEKFKYMAPDLQKEYLLKLTEKYGVRGKDVADMLGITAQTLFSFCRRKGWDIFGHTGGAMKPEVKKKWQAFLNGEEIAEEPQAEELPVPVPAEEEAVLVVSEPAISPVEDEAVEAEREAKIRAAEHPAEAVNQMQLNSFTLQFSGEFNPDTIRNTLAAILGGGKLVQVEIKCTVEG